MVFGGVLIDLVYIVKFKKCMFLELLFNYFFFLKLGGIINDFYGFWMEENGFDWFGYIVVIVLRFEFFSEGMLFFFWYGLVLISILFWYLCGVVYCCLNVEE